MSADFASTMGPGATSKGVSTLCSSSSSSSSKGLMSFSPSSILLSSSCDHILPIILGDFCTSGIPSHTSLCVSLGTMTRLGSFDESSSLLSSYSSSVPMLFILIRKSDSFGVASALLLGFQSSSKDSSRSDDSSLCTGRGDFSGIGCLT